jgi:hypothetical protein
MKYKILIFLLLVSGSVFSKKPAWIQQRPRSDGSYIGIGFAKKYEKNYMEVAKVRAMEDLINSIHVTVSSTTAMQQQENNGSVKSSYQSDLLVSSQAELAHYEIVETWQDKAEFWYYISKSKAEWEKEKQERAQALLNEAEQKYSAAQSALKDHRFDDYIFDTQSAMILLDRLSGPASSIYGAQVNDLYTKAKNAQDSFLVKLKIIPGEPELSPANRQLTFRVCYLCDSLLLPVRNVLLKISTTMPLRLTETEKETNQDGEAVYNIQFLDGQKSTVNETMLSVYSRDTTLGCFEKGLFKHRLKPLQVYLNVHELNFGRLYDEQVLRNKWLRVFNQSWIITVDSRFSADYVLTFQSNTRKYNEVNGLFVSYCDYSYDLSDSKGILFNNQGSAKGMKPDLTFSGLDAIKKTAEMIENQEKKALLNALNIVPE